MKKRLLTFALALVLLAGLATAALAGAGGSDDPLVTLSYLADTFRAKVRSAFSRVTGEAIERAKTAEKPVAAREMLAGESLRLTEGQEFLLISGAAKLYAGSGCAVDTVHGTELRAGSAALNTRCIVCEESELWLDFTAPSIVYVSSAAEKGTGSAFADVLRGDWFYADVVSACGRGLVNGMSTDAYAPQGTLTWAQAVKLAACMHELYHTGAVTLAPGEGDWYRSYADYALKKGVLVAEPEDWNAVITRRDFVALFYRALPAKEYTARNAVADGAIPDVAMTDEGAKEIYAFYRAGILLGYADGSFGPENTVTRAEIAAIMNRMFDPDARKTL